MKIIDELIAHPEFCEGVHWHKVGYAAKDVIIEQGSIGNDLFLIETGVVRVLGAVELEDNRKIQPGVCDLNAGEVFGEFSLFDNLPRSATITCINKCQLRVINGDNLQNFFSDHPDLGYRFMQEMMLMFIKRLRTSNEKVYSLLAWGLKAHKINQHLI